MIFSGADSHQSPPPILILSRKYELKLQSEHEYKEKVVGREMKTVESAGGIIVLSS